MEQRSLMLLPSATAQGTYDVLAGSSVEGRAMPIAQALRLLEALAGQPAVDRLGTYTLRTLGGAWCVYLDGREVGQAATPDGAAALLVANVEAEARGIAHRLAAYYGELRTAALGCVVQARALGGIEGGTAERLHAALQGTSAGAALLYDVLEAVEGCADPGTPMGASAQEALRSLLVMDRAAMARALRAFEGRDEAEPE